MVIFIARRSGYRVKALLRRFGLLPGINMAVVSRVLICTFVVLTTGSVQAAPPPMTDVAYGPDGQQRLDLCLADTSAKATPAVVLLHGGGWSSGKKDDFREVCRSFAAHGITAASVNYRLVGAGKARWPAPLVDAQLAVRWLRAHADQWNIDKQRICAFGNSSGAHLAVFLATLQHTIPATYSDELPDISSRVACAIDNFGPADFTVPSPFLDALDRLFDRPHTSEQLRAISPLFAVDANTAPVFIAQGLSDKAVPSQQSMALYRALMASGVKTEAVFFDGGHEWLGVSTPEKAAILQLEINFVSRYPLSDRP